MYNSVEGRSAFFSSQQFSLPLLANRYHVKMYRRPKAIGLCILPYTRMRSIVSLWVSFAPYFTQSPPIVSLEPPNPRRWPSGRWIEREVFLLVFMSYSFASTPSESFFFKWKGESVRFGSLCKHLPSFCKAVWFFILALA